MNHQSSNDLADFKETSADLDKEMKIGGDAEKNTKIRKRIDELLEKKRLKELLDDSDDWDV